MAFKLINTRFWFEQNGIVWDVFFTKMPNGLIEVAVYADRELIIDEESKKPITEKTALYWLSQAKKI